MSKMADINKAESYHEVKGAIESLSPRARKILAALNFSYKTRRELSEELKIEISSLCGPLFNLRKRGFIREAFSAECPVTGKTVVVYTNSIRVEQVMMVGV